MVAGAVGGNSKNSQVLPRRINVSPQIRFGIRRRIRGDNVKATRQVKSSPTCANHSRSNNCYISNRFSFSHDESSPFLFHATDRSCDRRRLVLSTEVWWTFLQERRKRLLALGRAKSRRK